jgi:hypothetical protein
LKVYRQCSLIGRRGILDQSYKQASLGENFLPTFEDLKVRIPHTSIVSPRSPDVEHFTDGCGELAVEDHAMEQGSDHIAGSEVSIDDLARAEPRQVVLSDKLGVPFRTL